MERNGNSLGRVAVVAGIVSFAIFVLAMLSTPSSPMADDSNAEIARGALESREGYLWGAYLFSLQTTAFLVFAGALVALLRVRERGGGGWWIVAAIGAAGTVTDLAGQAVLAAWVYAAGHGVEGEPLRAVFSLHTPLVYVGALPAAVFFLGTGLGARATRLLPRWLAWASVGLAALLVLGAGSLTGNESEDGVFGAAFVLGWLGTQLWTLAVTIALWRGSRRPDAPSERVPVAA